MVLTVASSFLLPHHLSTGSLFLSKKTQFYIDVTEVPPQSSPGALHNDCAPLGSDVDIFWNVGSLTAENCRWAKSEVCFFLIQLFATPSSQLHLAFHSVSLRFHHCDKSDLREEGFTSAHSLMILDLIAGRHVGRSVWWLVQKQRYSKTGAHIFSFVFSLDLRLWSSAAP